MKETFIRTFHLYGEFDKWLNHYQIYCPLGETRKQSLARVKQDLLNGKISHWDYKLGKIKVEEVVKIVLTK